MEKTQEKRSGKKNSGRVAGVALKIVCFLLETVLLLLIAAYSVLFMPVSYTHLTLPTKA